MLLMKLASKHRLLLFIVLIVIVLISIVGGAIAFNCYRRDTIISQAPIYPGALLIGQDTLQDSKGATRIQYKYEINDSFPKIRDFYTKIASCTPNDDQMYCTGKADPFGAYDVIINHTGESIQNYSVEVGWNKCGDIFELSVE
jgi:hypothetical protein